MNVNSIQKHRLSEKIDNYFKGDLKGRTIALWGLAFKPNTDDIREAPALYIIEDLLAKGAKVKAFDPEAMDNVKKIFGGKIHFASDQYEALIDADALAIVTEWSVFRTPSFKVLQELMANPAIFDGRNLYDIDSMKDLGFYYDSIGRNNIQG
ncbi:MAG: UDP binding domain-containing protein [Saprospiraceae bacterium]